MEPGNDEDQSRYCAVPGCGNRAGVGKSTCALHPPPEPDKYQAISESRSEEYGDPRISHTAIGLAWEGSFRNRYQQLVPALEAVGIKPGELYPAEFVALMMSQFKDIRSARPVFKQDSYDDGTVYRRYSEEWRRE